MKIKLDENLPLDLAPMLRGLGHEVDTSQDEGLAGESDERVWQATQQESRFLITQDLDFSDLRKFRPGSHRGILVLRLDAPSQHSLIASVERIFRRENVVAWIRCLVVATEHRIRIVKPQELRDS
jgi:predicted nuclease of predicted toxin-antitoxin system